MTDTDTPEDEFVDYCTKRFRQMDTCKNIKKANRAVAEYRWSLKKATEYLDDVSRMQQEIRIADDIRNRRVYLD